MKRVAWACLLLLLPLGSACNKGSGSDIGPEIQPELPGNAYRVLIRDDQGLGVSAAVVSVSGITQTAVSGRSGRANLLSIPSGFRLITVDGSNASATDTDQLGTLTVSASTPDGNELPYVFNLPDVSQSTGLTLSTGVQATPGTLDDSGTSGVILTVPAGSSVGLGAATSVTLQTGSLQGQHLPGVLPPPPSGALLTGQGAYVAPNGVTFAPGVDLSLPNDLLLSGGSSADLLFLDPVTGSWVTVGTGTVSGTRIVASGLVSQGGLYTFVTPTPAASISGRVVDVDNRSVSGVLVRGGEAWTRTAGNGTFLLAGVASEYGDGSPRTVTVEFTGGRDFWPASTTTGASLPSGGTAILGDVTLETFRVANARIMLITRGREDPQRRIGVSSTDGSTAFLSIGDDSAQHTFEEQKTGFLGWLTSYPKDSSQVFVSWGIAELENGTFIRDLQVFSNELSWRHSTSGGSRLFVVDSRGTGGVNLAGITRGIPPNTRYGGLTNEGGNINLDLGSPGQATASMATAADGRLFITAITITDPESGRVEFPLERANRLPTGNFDRFGLVSGDLVGGGGGSLTRVMRSTRLLDRNDWYDSVFFGLDVQGDVPFKVDPAVTGGTAFTVGLTADGGNLTAAEGTTAAGVFTMDRMGVASGLMVPQGSRLSMDLSLSHPANTVFTAPNALNNLDGAIALADLRFDLALAQGDSTIDAVRDIGGNMTFSGLDVLFTLPSLGGFPAGTDYLLAFGGSSTSAGTTIDQRTVLTLDGNPPPVVQFMDVPAILSPAPGAMVPASGFTVDYTVPISTLYVVVDLRAEMPTETRAWRAVLPASFTSFEFFTPPTQVANPLAPGITWTLSVTAARVESGPLFGFMDSYSRMVSHFVGISAAERVVNAFSTSRITIITN